MRTRKFIGLTAAVTFIALLLLPSIFAALSLSGGLQNLVVVDLNKTTSSTTDTYSLNVSALVCDENTQAIVYNGSYTKCVDLSSSSNYTNVYAAIAGNVSKFYPNATVNALITGNKTWNYSAGKLYPSNLMSMVGIGTASPNQNLTVIGRANITKAIVSENYESAEDIKFFIDTDDNSNSATFQFCHNGDSSSLAYCFAAINDSGSYFMEGGGAFYGRVGVGTLAPTVLLDVDGTQLVTDAVMNFNSPQGYYSEFRFANNGTYLWRMGKDNDVISPGNINGDFYINRFANTGGYLGTSFWINRTNGYMSFGRALPTAPFNFWSLGSTEVRIESGNGVSNPFVSFYNGTSDRMGFIQGVFATSPYMRWYADDGNIVLYPNVGKVGVKTYTPTQDFTVNGNANVSGTIYYGALVANSPHFFGADPDTGYTNICVKDKQGYFNRLYFDAGIMKISANDKICNDKNIKLEHNKMIYDQQQEEIKSSNPVPVTKKEVINVGVAP